MEGGHTAMSDGRKDEQDIAILAPFGRDAALIESVLRETGLTARSVANATELVQCIPEAAAIAIVAEESLSASEIVELAQKLDAQPPWSDFPMIVLTGS